MTKHNKPAEPRIPHFLAQSATFHDMVAQLAAEIDDKGGPGAGANYIADFVLNELEPRGVLVAILVNIAMDKEGRYTAESEERARERAEVYAEKIMPLMEGME
jgi:hypothetical protein